MHHSKIIGTWKEYKYTNGTTTTPVDKRFLYRFYQDGRAESAIYLDEWQVWPVNKRWNFENGELYLNSGQYKYPINIISDDEIVISYPSWSPVKRYFKRVH